MTYEDTGSVTAPSTDINFPLQQDVSITLANAGFDLFKTHAQSATFSFELGVEPLNQLGGAMAYARVPSYPATATLAIEGLAVSGKLGVALSDINNIQQRSSTGTDLGYDQYDVSVSIGGHKYELVNASVDSVSFDSSIGDNATANITFGSSIGGEKSRSTMRVVAA